ncbi:MAG: thioredoxin family protein [Candidatus Aenigmarchaeota archaeon]|nr:thioredoxin family protein [Candidatus Aenigmarchaeota archaeon]
MSIKYTFLLAFLLLMPIVAAKEIQVLYFYSSACPVCQQVEPYKNNLSNYWKEKVDWIEYDFMVDRNREFFVNYRIANVPVAIVKCFNQTYRIERNDIEEKLNKTIAGCYGLIARPEESKNLFLLLLLIFVVVLIFLRKPRKRVKKRVKKLASD